MDAAGKNRMERHFMELTGLRMVKMYVTEFFHWGYQEIDQQNDDGLDGVIILRDRGGKDMGVRIHCQIKCGPAYEKSSTNDEIVIQAYSNKQKWEEKLRHYARMAEPAILIYVNPKNNKKWPPCWWVRVDNYAHDGSSQLRIPRRQSFGEHSKGDLLELVRPILKDWNNHPQLTLSSMERKLCYSRNLLQDARHYYDDMKQYPLNLGKSGVSVKWSRTGWRHINTLRRGDVRINTSLSLLSLARRMIETWDGNLETRDGIVLLRGSRVDSNDHCMELFYGLRNRLMTDTGEEKIQVVLKRRINKHLHKDTWWFYSVHRIKK